MSEWNRLDQLKPIADEMLSGLHADDALKRRIREAAVTRTPRRTRSVRAFAPAVCCAALAVVCVGVVGAGRLRKAPEPVQIDTITAGAGADEAGAQLIAGIGDGASVRVAAARQSVSLFSQGEGDMPIIAVGGGVYRMLDVPQAVSDSLLGEAVGAIEEQTDEPSLASEDAMEAGLSNVAQAGGEVYAVAGVSSSTALAARVDGAMRLFQRVSYAGRGPGGQGLEDTFDVRGRVASLELSEVGALEGEAANAAIDVLLDNAVLVAQDAAERRQYLTVTLDNGLRLQLSASGSSLVGCGEWSCPEFFEAFEASL